MEEEEEKRSKASDYQSGQNSKAVLEVHQRVADLMKLAEQMLPPEEADDDDGLPKKSIREKLRDAWDGDGYYAKLMKEQDSGPSSSASSSRTSSTPPTSNGNSNNNKSKTNSSNGKKEGLKVYCDKENPVAHKVNRGAKKASGLGGGLSSSGGGGKLAVGCGNTGGGLANHAPKPLVQRTALISALGNVTNASSSAASDVYKRQNPPHNPLAFFAPRLTLCATGFSLSQYTFNPSFLPVSYTHLTLPTKRIV